MATRNTLPVWVKLKDCDGVERQPTYVNVQSDGFVDDVIKEGLAVSKVNIAPNLVKVFSSGDSIEPIDTVVLVNDLIQRNCGTISSPLFLQCPQWKSVTTHPTRKQKKSYLPQEKIPKFKLVLLGRSSVGKSCLLQRVTTGEFSTIPPTLPGTNCSTITIKVGSKPVKLELWDTAGQEQFAPMAPLYYRRAQAAIVVYDITDMDTFKGAKSWVKELREERPSIVIALAGNKADLNTMRQVEFEQARSYAEESHLIFMETSAKTDRNVSNIFQAIANKLPKYDPTQQQAGVDRSMQPLSTAESRQQGTKCC